MLKKNQIQLNKTNEESEWKSKLYCFNNVKIKLTKNISVYTFNMNGFNPIFYRNLLNKLC